MMAGSVNKALLIGNVGKDPEVRHSQQGEKIVNLTLATGESWTDRATGERKERTEWHRIVIFNDRIADVAEKYVRKGSKIYVEGALQTRKWTDQSGADRYQTEVVISKFRGELTLLDSRGANNGQAEEAAAVRPQERAAPRAEAPRGKPIGAGVGTDLDDEIPFAPCWQ